VPSILYSKIQDTLTPNQLFSNQYFVHNLLTITQRGGEENKPWLIALDVLTGSPVVREAVGHSSFVLPIYKLVDLDTRIFDEAAKNTK
jgi:hypothetical protein